MKTGESLDDFFRFFGLEENGDFESSTVNGWLSELCGHIPQAGEELTYGRLKILVTEADEQMTRQIEVQSEPEKPEKTEKTE